MEVSCGGLIHLSLVLRSHLDHLALWDLETLLQASPVVQQGLGAGLNLLDQSINLLLLIIFMVSDRLRLWFGNRSNVGTSFLLILLTSTVGCDGVVHFLARDRLDNLIHSLCDNGTDLLVTLATDHWLGIIVNVHRLSLIHI